MGRSLKQRGRALLEAEQVNARNDATLSGVRPRKGLWLVHPGRNKLYGKILRVRRNGDVVWWGRGGVPVTTHSETLINGGYEYRAHAYMEGVE